MGWSEAAVNQLYEDIGRRIRDARQRRDYTQADLARSLGMTRSSVANFEAGRQRVTVHLLLQIAEELGSSVSELLGEPTPSLSAVADGTLAAVLDGQPDTTTDFVAGALRRAE
jgi:transcriptional regulator with XRE-family HTH domain